MSCRPSTATITLWPAPVTPPQLEVFGEVPVTIFQSLRCQVKKSSQRLAYKLVDSCIFNNNFVVYKKLFRFPTGTLRFPSIYGNSRFSKQFEITSGKKTINIRTLAAEKRYKCMIFFLAPWSVDRRQQMHKHSVVLLYRTHAGIETNADCVTTFVDCICSCMKYTLVQNISLLFLTHNQWH